MYETTIATCRTLWGWIGTAHSQRGLLSTTLPVPTREEASARLLRCWPDASHAVTGDVLFVHDLLKRYFVGEPVDLRLCVLDARRATPFLREAWQGAQEIPRGQVRSYGWLAAQLGRPRAARAVGRAMALNPFPIVVPCHRMVGSDGSLTGFAGGIAMKRRLLDLESDGLFVAEHVDHCGAHE